LPFVDKDRAALDAVDIAPFRAAIDSGIDAIMPAHVVYEALDPSGLPATLSEPILTGLLRGELGFTGVIVTDDLGMEGIMQIAPPEESGVRVVIRTVCGGEEATRESGAKLLGEDRPADRIGGAPCRLGWDCCMRGCGRSKRCCRRRG
jgi:hypothetical protein